MLHALEPVDASQTGPFMPRDAGGVAFLAALDKLIGRGLAQAVPREARLSRDSDPGAAPTDEAPERRRRHAALTASVLAVSELQTHDDPTPSAAVRDAEAVAEQDRLGSRPERGTARRDAGRPSPEGRSVAPRNSTAGHGAHTQTDDVNAAGAVPPGAHAQARAPVEVPRSTGMRVLPGLQVESAPRLQAVATPSPGSLTASARSIRVEPAGAAPLAPRGPLRAGTAQSRPMSAPPTARPSNLYQPDPDPLTNQVGRGLASLLGRDGGSVTLRLEPHSLGELTVHLSVAGGRVEATLDAGTDRARALLESSLHTLRSALEAHGLTVDRLAVRTAEQPVERQDADGPGVGPDPEGPGGRAGGGDATGAEHPGTGGAMRATRVAADRRAPVDVQPEGVVTPEGIGVGSGGAPMWLRLDTLA